ncbi:DUF6522 family protein [Thermomonas sp.]|uniref:DUF6522 family protein n=1 Tax=Thermomonas sp. TaxID=1971895 RepID=UPI0035B02A68
MAKPIHLALNPTFEIEIDAGPIADALGVTQDIFFTLLEQRRISQLCERGTGEDAGSYRASFYLDDKRARVVVDRNGRMLGTVERRP